jgi:hypothetical protein
MTPLPSSGRTAPPVAHGDVCCAVAPSPGIIAVVAVTAAITASVGSGSRPLFIPQTGA